MIFVTHYATTIADYRYKGPFRGYVDACSFSFWTVIVQDKAYMVD
jgi:hypothetical protein